MMNKKGIAPIVILAGILGVMLVIYLIIFANPFGAFTSVKAVINFTLTFVLFIAIQALVFVGIYEVAKFGRTAFLTYKNKITKWGFNLKSWIALH